MPARKRRTLAGQAILSAPAHPCLTGAAPPIPPTIARHEPVHHHRPRRLTAVTPLKLAALRPIMSEYGYMHRRCRSRWRGSSPRLMQALQNSSPSLPEHALTCSAW